MEQTTLLYSVWFALLGAIALKLFKRPTKNIPPSPAPALPLVGHLHLVQKPLHRALYKFSQKCGPIFSVRFGSRLVVVVSSPSLVVECFTKNDVVLSNRPKNILAKYIGYNYSSIAEAPYGDHWRNLRKLAANEIFSPARLSMFLSIRQDEVRRLLQKVYEDSSRDFTIVEMPSKLHELTFNVIMRMTTGKRYFGEDEDNAEAEKFRKLLKASFEYSGASNPADFIPLLRWVNYQNYEKNVANLSKDMDVLLQGLIEKHRTDGKSKNTMIDHLLMLQESDPEHYSDEIIKSTILVLLRGGVDTSSVTVEWAMSLLLNHPRVLEKARAEIDTYVGTNRLVDEQDLSELPYLHNIIQETFRLCPPGPVLVPRESSDDCKIGGYDIPSGTLLFVNAWEIHRDPKVWDDPTSFKPERFEGVTVEASKLMPFGMGRRSCPAYGLARRVIGLALGSLIHCFEWQRLGPEEVDLTEGGGLSMTKAVPLEVKFKARNFVHKVLVYNV